MRHFAHGDDARWCQVYAASFDREFDPDAFRSIMAGDDAYLPQRIWFITHGDDAVATAAAYYRPAFLDGYGMIHFVGVVPGHRGLGLGHTVTVAALRRMVAEQRAGAWLSTDDHRIPAVKTYISLGFEPLLVHAGQPERWKNVLAQIEPHLADRFRSQLDADIYRPQSSSARRADR